MNLFQIFSKLVDNNDKHGLEFLSYHFTNALNITISAMIVQGFTEKPLSRRKMLHLLNVCFIGIRRISMNSFQWSNVGTCVCLIASLFNHRCDNNAEWKFIDGYYHLNVCRPIAAYEEISINYGCGWPLSTFEQRLRQHSCYFFQCNCIQYQDDNQDNQDNQCPDNDAICLLCYQPYTNTRQTLNRLKFLRNQIHLITNMFGCLKENLHEKYLMILKSCMNELTELMYRKNRILMDDLQKCCEIFVENSSSSTILTDVDHQFLIKFGQIIDNILPEYDLELPKIDSLDDETFKQEKNLNGITRYLLQNSDNNHHHHRYHHHHSDDDYDNQENDDNKDNNDLESSTPTFDDEIRSTSFWTNYLSNLLRQYHQEAEDSSASTMSSPSTTDDIPEKELLKNLCKNFYKRLFALLEFRIRMLSNSNKDDDDDDKSGNSENSSDKDKNSRQLLKQQKQQQINEEIELLTILIESKKNQMKFIIG
ncbi:hypothetical protein DERP_003643 [Dermatophagoides pteronyssinus]|uniref:SET domain-containing protein n=1 Tax=Dermatophagoides pteronyssinus TaxID=6956 RepID=A0ABQ8JL84_DERPT|nr:hypothetical protein DERP_003643 [Dermatophagoides pteronyssinus]